MSRIDALRRTVPRTGIKRRFDTRCVLTLLSLFALVTPAWAGETGVLLAQSSGSPRYHFEQLLSAKPVGQTVTVRVTWGDPYTDGLSDCVAYLAGDAGLTASPSLPTGVFVQVGVENLGDVQGLTPGDQVDVTGLVDWATCASGSAQGMGWIGLQPTAVTRVAKVGEQAPAEPAATAPASTAVFAEQPPAQVAPVRPSMDSAPRATVGELLSSKPVGHRVVIRTTWGSVYGEPDESCIPHIAGEAGLDAAPDLPTGVFAQAPSDAADLTGGLTPGDHVDVLGTVEFARCASSAAETMGWVAVRIENLERVARAGETPPAEPPSTLAASMVEEPAAPATGGSEAPSTAPVVVQDAPPAALPGYEAIVHLTDGNTLHGRVLGESVDQLTLLIAGSELAVERSKVKRVEMLSPPAAEQEAETVAEAPPPPPPKKELTPEERALQKKRDEAGAKIVTGSLLLIPSCIFIPVGLTYLGGGIQYEADGYTDAPADFRDAIYGGTWPVGFGVFLGMGIPLLVTSTQLMAQGKAELDALDGAEIAAVRQRRRPALAAGTAPWVIWSDQGVAVGWSGRF